MADRWHIVHNLVDALARMAARGLAHLHNQTRGRRPVRTKASTTRMLGLTSEAEDAVQEAWLRINRTNSASLQNVGGWLRRLLVG